MIQILTNPVMRHTNVHHPMSHTSIPCLHNLHTYRLLHKQ
jgi:hypothetical protein